MNFPAKSLHNFPSCTKSVTVRVEKDVIKLKQNREVFINGEEVVINPSVWIDALYIRHASSNFLAGKMVELWTKENYLFLILPIFLLFSYPTQRIGNLVGWTNKVKIIFFSFVSV